MIYLNYLTAFAITFWVFCIISGFVKSTYKVFIILAEIIMIYLCLYNCIIPNWNNTPMVKDYFCFFADTTFICPHCGKQHEDSNDKYCNRINKNKSFKTTIKCECKKTFNLTFDCTGKFQSYE